MTWHPPRWPSLIALVLGCALVIYAFLPQIDRIQEEVMLALFPSAQRAFAYGERHFDAEHPRLYDVARANDLFWTAAHIDPSLAYVYHELARISFLKGKLRTALSQIDLQISLHGDDAPNSYYVRGLIEGYLGMYENAAADYRHFLNSDPDNWAAMADYAWVLLKNSEFEEAAAVTAQGLSLYPANPWLLNSHAIALFELGSTTEAYSSAGLASMAAKQVTEAEWLHAYPGNDPAVAGEGVATLQRATVDNLLKIQRALASSTIQ